MADVIITPSSGIIEFKPSSTTVNKIEASGTTFNLVNTVSQSGTIFNIEGTNGSLFSVVDNLDGTLMSVNNNAGLPVLEVFSDDSVVAGRFGQNDFVISSGGNIGIGQSPTSNKLSIDGNVRLDGNLSFAINGSDGFISLNPSASTITMIDTGAASMININTTSMHFYADGEGAGLYLDRSNARVGILTTTPSTALDVNGTVTATSFSGAGTGLTGTASSLTAGAVTNGVYTSRSINTTSPISGGGNLSADRTIALSAAYGDTLNPYGSKTANTFLAAPNGSTGVPSFRAIVAADIPTLNQNTTGTSAGVSTTVAAGSDTNLLYATIGANDYFRLRVGGASNAGYAEIATADDGTEPIYVRQYTGVFTTLTRTATLLDASGNTTFPGSVTASSFVKSGATSSDLLQAGGGNVSAGSLSVSYAGTAGSATSAQQVANTLTIGSYLTGNNFNGSAATTWAVDATSSNTASKVVARDSSGNFSAGTITATLSGNASTVTNGVYTTGNQSIGGVKTFTDQIINTTANNTANGGGQIYLNGSTGNRIDFNTNGVAAPTFTTRSAGTKIVLYPGVGASAVDFGLGIENSTLWLSVAQTVNQFKWYAGTTNIATLTGAGVLSVGGSTSQINVDNLRLDGNTISTTNTNGNLILTPNGNGGIAGGSSATVTGAYSVVAGGRCNTASGYMSTVGGGFNNAASYGSATIGGGRNNSSSGNNSTVSGGYCNTASGYYQATVGGGKYNYACGSSSTVSGGYTNTASGYYSTVGGGGSNTSNGSYSTLAGGGSNTANGHYSTVSGGSSNCACSTNSSISGGGYNFVNARHGSINGGHYNRIQSATNECCSRGAVIGGGVGNNTSGGTVNATTGDISGTVTCYNAGAFSTIGGGLQNRSICAYATVGGGRINVGSAGGVVVAGGTNNSASGGYATVGGGINNVNSGAYGTIAGGLQNGLTGNSAAVGGGRYNCAYGNWTTVAGGNSNKICSGASGSFIGGGENNIIYANSINTSILGGSFNVNSASSCYGVTLGGYGNTNSGWYNLIGVGTSLYITSSAGTCWSVIVGGNGNEVCDGILYGAILNGAYNCTASGYYSTIINGAANSVSANYGTIINGYGNCVQNEYSTIAGCGITTDRACTLFVNNLSIKNIPTSAAGLPAGSVFSCAGVLRIV